MNTSDITLTIFIIWLYSILHTFSKLTLEMNNIKNNWTDYRCKPVIMLFAEAYGHDAYDNFSYCVQNIQSASTDKQLNDVNQTNEINNKNMQLTNDALDSAEQANKETNDKMKQSTKFSGNMMQNLSMGVKRFGKTVGSFGDAVKAKITLSSGKDSAEKGGQSKATENEGVDAVF